MKPVKPRDRVRREALELRYLFTERRGILIVSPHANVPETADAVALFRALDTTVERIDVLVGDTPVAFAVREPFTGEWQNHTATEAKR
jgi:hypothetical protein